MLVNPSIAKYLKWLSIILIPWFTIFASMYFIRTIDYSKLPDLDFSRTELLNESRNESSYLVISNIFEKLMNPEAQEIAEKFIAEYNINSDIIAHLKRTLEKMKTNELIHDSTVAVYHQVIVDLSKHNGLLEQRYEKVVKDMELAHARNTTQGNFIEQERHDIIYNTYESTSPAIYSAEKSISTTPFTDTTDSPEDKAEQLVKRFMAGLNGEVDLDQLLSCFDEVVIYFKEGNADHHHIRNSNENFFRLYPQRKFSFKEISLIDIGASQYQLTFECDCQLINRKGIITRKQLLYTMELRLKQGNFVITNINSKQKQNTNINNN